MRRKEGAVFFLFLFFLLFFFFISIFWVLSRQAKVIALHYELQGGHCLPTFSFTPGLIFRHNNFN